MKSFRNHFIAGIAVSAFCLLAGAFTLGATEYSFVTVTDYETGSAAVIWLDASYTTDTGVASIHSDAVGRWYNGLIYVVNRLNGDNIQVLDPEGGFSTLRQYSTGNGTNPQDIAFLTETKAYITSYDTNELIIMNTLTGEILGTIDLSAFADSDGLCEMAYMSILHDILFVTIQRLDRNNYWGPVGDSYVAVIDCATDLLIDTDPETPGVQAIALTGTNPFSEIRFDHASGRLHVSCVGWWGMQDGGVEIINPFTYQSEGYLLTETAAGGDINDFELLDGSKGYAIVTTASFNTELISFNPATGVKVSTLYAPGAYVLNDIEISPYDELFLADQTALDPGIRIFDTGSDTEITSGPISTGLPPFDICFSIPVISDGKVPLQAMLGMNYPNPFNPVTTIPFSTESSGEVNISIHDVTGRKIRTVTSRFYTAGAHKATWNGTDEKGCGVSSGVYFAVMRAKGTTLTNKLILLR